MQIGRVDLRAIVARFPTRRPEPGQHTQDPSKDMRRDPSGKHTGLRGDTLEIRTGLDGGCTLR